MNRGSLPNSKQTRAESLLCDLFHRLDGSLNGRLILGWPARDLDGRITPLLRELRDLLLEQGLIVETSRGSIGLTEKGVALARRLIRIEGTRPLNAPFPDDLPELREELDYWESNIHDEDANSDRWIAIQTRIDGLRHRERLKVERQPYVQINSATGPNSRINISSNDQSHNGSSLAQSDGSTQLEATDTFGPLNLEITEEWRYLAYDATSGTWEDGRYHPNRRQSLLLAVKNRVAPVGQRGRITPPLVAHLEIIAGSSQEEIDNAYWVDKEINEVTLRPGQSAAIIAGFVDHPYWSAHNNPNLVSPFQGIIPAVLVPVGRKHSVLMVFPITVNLSILSSNRVETFAQHKCLIHSKSGRFIVERLI